MAKTPAAPVPDRRPRRDDGRRQGPRDARRAPSRRRPASARSCADTKEAKARAKAELAAQREKARVGMAAGDDRYLPVRDKGPQRKFVRDFVDSGWHLGEAVMPAMVLVILATFIPSRRSSTTRSSACGSSSSSSSATWSSRRSA